MREVHEGGVGADVGVLCRMDPCEVLVLDEDWVLRRLKRSECEGTLEVLTGRWIIEVDGVCLEDVVAINCGGVDVLDEFAGVERGVVEVADGEGYGVCGRW